MTTVSVAFPGPWWTPLTYKCARELPIGVRVRAPLGRSQRVGVTVNPSAAADFGQELKEITEVIDEAPPLPPELWRTAEWFSEMWFVGMGLTLKTLLPSKFFDGEELERYSFRSADSKEDAEYVYNPNDEERLKIYRGLVSQEPDGTLVLFPDQTSAKRFWETLPDGLRTKGALYPASGPAAQWKMWKRIRAGEFAFAVGAQTAVTLPMPKLNLVIFEDESSYAWRTQKHPEHHKRSLAAVRARNAGAKFVLGGRMASPKAWMRVKDCDFTKEGIGARTVFVNMFDAKGYFSEGLKERLPISIPLVRETGDALSAGKWALWILDRKGYSGEIYCDECGSSVFCPECGGLMRWEDRHERLYCSRCRKSSEVPSQCPSCGGLFLEGHRPGTEAICARAERIFKGRDVVYIGDKMRLGELVHAHPNGALAVGTRRIIALADTVEVGTVGWIDADGEARSPDYDAKARAFGMIWESAWRGLAPDGRTVVVQSKRPAKDWHRGLLRGWGFFWEEELRERALLELPPFVPMVKIDSAPSKKKKLADALLDGDFQFIEPEESPREIWVRTKSFAKLRALLARFSGINSARSGIPKATVYLD